MRRVLAGSVFLLSCLSGEAQLQQDSVFASPGSFVLDEMVISGFRWEQNLREIPTTTVKISASSVRFQNPQTTADLLATSNKVFIQKSQLGGGSPMIRGFATNRVLMVVDGVRMNNAILRSGNAQNVISLDANSISEAEVIFGPGSVMYGSDAIGGVMDFHTLRPILNSTPGKTMLSGSAMTRYASANKEKTVHADFNIGQKKWAFLSSFTVASYDDLRMGTHGPDEYTRPDYVAQENGDDVLIKNSDPNLQTPSGYSQANFMQKIHFAANQNWQFTYGYQYSRTSDYARYDRLLIRDDDDLANAEWYYGPQKWQMHSFTIKQTGETILSSHSKMILAFQEYEESRHNRGFGSPRKTNRFEKVGAASLNVDADKKIGEALKVFYGVEAVVNRVGSKAFRNNVETGEIAATSTRYPSDSHWATYGAYASAKYGFSKWTLNISGRINHVVVRSEFENDFFDFPFSEANLEATALNGSIGLVFNPGDAWKLHGNLSTGFRAPNVDDIGKVFDSEPGNVVVPNPSLEPEKAFGIELGTVGKLGGVTTQATIFYTTISNAIARAVSTFNGEDSVLYDGVLSRVLSQQNINRINIFGFELEINCQLTRSFQAKSTLNWQTGKENDIESGRDLTPNHVAPMFGSTHVIYDRNKLKLDAYANYNGEISFADLAPSERNDAHFYAADADGNPYAPNWYTLNLKGSYKLRHWLTIDAGIENITDKRYRPYSSGISAPGRNFIAALRFAL